MHIFTVFGIIRFGIIDDCFVISHVCNLLKSLFYYCYTAGFSMCTNKIIFFGLFLANLVGFFLQNHVYRQSTAQGPPEDRGRKGSS
jgi:hypothetical protein